MRNMFRISGLLFLLVLSGCASKAERVGFDAKKASAANSELGVAYLSRGQYKVAMNKLKKALEFDNTNADAHHYIAELYRRLNENSLADSHYKEALDLKSKDSSIKNNYGIFLCNIGSYDKGLKLFNEVLLDPVYSDKGQAYENMGLCAEKEGNIRNAEKYYATALKFNKNLPSALLGLAQISFDKKNITAASDFLSRHKKLSRPSSQSLWLELLIARKRGIKGQVGTLALKLKQFFPDSREVKLLEKLKLR